MWIMFIKIVFRSPYINCACISHRNESSQVCLFTNVFIIILGFFYLKHKQQGKYCKEGRSSPLLCMKVIIFLSEKKSH